MSKGYENYSTQCAVAQNTKKTLAFYANLELAEKHRFAEILDNKSKIKVSINDFSNGKGDNATKVYANLEVSEVFYVFEKAKAGLLPKFSSIKSLDAYPEREGQFKGLVQIRILAIEYIQGNNNPWKIQITNGYGKNGKISAGQKAANFFMTDQLFLDLFRKSVQYIELFINTFAPPQLVEGKKNLDSNAKGQQSNVEQPVYYDNSDHQYEAPIAQPEPVRSGPYNPEAVIDKVQVISDIAPLQGGNGYFCNVLRRGQQECLFMKDKEAQIEGAYKSQSIIDLYVFYFGNKLCLDSVA